MSDWFTPIVLFDGEDELTLKREFALLWAKYPTYSPVDIGRQLFRDRFEPMRGLQAGAVWSRDLEVMRMYDEFKRNGGDSDASDLPSKEQWLREVLSIARDSEVDTKERLAAHRIYAESAGFIDKGGVNVNLNDNRVVNVLKVPMRDQSVEDNADFAVKFKAQQIKLVADARSNRAN